MRFVPIKNLEQQLQLMVRRAHLGFVELRTAVLNRIRGSLSEFGIVLPLRASNVRRRASECLEDLPGYANTVIGDLLSEVTRLDERVAQCDAHLKARPGQARCAGQTPDAALRRGRDHGHALAGDDRLLAPSLT